jgi:hypothetical protein
MKTFYYALIISIFLGLLSSVSAQDNEKLAEFPDARDLKKVGQAGYTFLKIGVDGRSTAIGEAAVTLEGDAATLFFNPAGITSVEGHSVFVGHTTWIADIGKSALAWAGNFGTWGQFGVSAVYMDYNTIEGTEIDPFNPIGYRDTGNIGVEEYAVGLTYGQRFTNKFGVAATVKYCRQDFGVVESAKVAMDVGTIYDIGWHGMKVAMSIQHFATDVKYIEETFQLPMTFHIGTSIDLFDLLGVENSTHEMDILIEGNNPIDYSERFHFGAEYWYQNMVALRAGYKLNYDEQGLTLGAGIRLSHFDLHYSFSSMGSCLGSANRFSANYNF